MKVSASVAESRPQQRCQSLSGLRVTFAGVDCCPARLLDAVEQRLAALLLQHLPDDHAQVVDVLAQAGVLGQELDIPALFAGGRGWLRNFRCHLGALAGRSGTGIFADTGVLKRYSGAYSPACAAYAQPELPARNSP